MWLILFRFSSDIDIMDNKLPESFRLWTIMIFSVMAVVLVVSITTPIFIAAIVPIGIFFIAFVVSIIVPEHQQMTCAPNEDSDQPVNLPSLITLHCRRVGSVAHSEEFDQTG